MPLLDAAAAGGVLVTNRSSPHQVHRGCPAVWSEQGRNPPKRLGEPSHRHESIAAHRLRAGEQIFPPGAWRCGQYGFYSEWPLCLRGGSYNGRLKMVDSSKPW